MSRSARPTTCPKENVAGVSVTLTVWCSSHWSRSGPSSKPHTGFTVSRLHQYGTVMCYLISTPSSHKRVFGKHSQSSCRLGQRVQDVQRLCPNITACKYHYFQSFTRDVQTTTCLDPLVLCRFSHRGLMGYRSPLPVLGMVLLRGSNSFSTMYMQDGERVSLPTSSHQDQSRADPQASNPGLPTGKQPGTAKRSAYNRSSIRTNATGK